MSTIYLGSCDVGKVPLDAIKFLAPFHYTGILSGKSSLRDDDRTTWRRFREIPGTEVTQLQEFLFKAGFMPRGIIDGIYGYVTQACARLFQEYVRTVEGVSNMVPDGIIGSGTWEHINRWKASGKVSDWGKSTAANPSTEFKKWMDILNKAKANCLQNPNPILKQVNNYSKASDTRAVKDWDFSPQEIHLIGIRRKQDVQQLKRENDDIFILLINGMVFKFWGSTDPNRAMSTDNNQAYLVEGQHKYRFGWHKITEEAKIYRALKPYQHGVLVFRDRNNDNALTETDLNIGLDPQPNLSINVHWSGIGSTNFSAGCQVIAGKSYINHLDHVVNCSGFAANSYSALNETEKQTKGAYNVCADLLMSYAKAGVNYIYYTIGKEDIFNIAANMGSNYTVDTLNRMKNI